MNFQGRDFIQMGQEYTLDEVIAAIEQDDQDKHDEIVPVSHIYLSSDGRLRLESETQISWHDMTPHAQTQLFNLLEIPTTYARRCPPELLQPHVEHWVKEYIQRRGSANNPPEWLIRFRGKTVRAVLTESYSIFDNRHIVDTLWNNRDMIKNFKIRMFHVDDSGFHLRLVDERISKDFGGREKNPLPRDVFHGGLHISNREIGGMSTRIEYFVLRLICTNGLVGIENLRQIRQYHKGRNMAERFAMRLSDAIASAPKRLENVFSQLDESFKEVTHHGADLIRYISGKESLTEEMTEAVLAQLNQGNLHTRYDVINAFTAGAREFQGDDRYKVEAVGGKLLTSSIVRLELEMREEEEKQRRKRERELEGAPDA